LKPSHLRQCVIDLRMTDFVISTGGRNLKNRMRGKTRFFGLRLEMTFMKRM
jgi:hypothetical protein